MCRWYLLKAYMTLGKPKRYVKENLWKGTELEKTSDVRDPKPQKPGGHWDAYPVEESYRAVLSLGFFIDICSWPLSWSHDAEQSRPLVWSSAVTSGSASLCYTACIRDSWSIFFLTMEVTFWEGRQWRQRATLLMFCVFIYLCLY